MTNTLRNLVATAVSCYSTEQDGFLTLDAFDLPDHELDQLAAAVMSEDLMLLAESTGPDNAGWDDMQQSMLATMAYPDNREDAQAFRDTWVAAVRNHAMPEIQRLIDERIGFINGDTLCQKGIRQQEMYC